MGQINLSRITDVNSILRPPTGVDSIYNVGGVFYTLNSSGSTSSLIETPIDGVGKTNYLAGWYDDNTINISTIEYVSGNYQAPEWSGWTSSTVMVGDADGTMTNSGYVYKQISVTVSGSEILQLYSTPKVLIPKSGTGIVHQVISAYVKVSPQTGPYVSNPLVIFEGGNGVTHECNALETTTTRRYRFIPRNTSSSLVQTIDDDNDIKLSVDTSNPTGGTGSLTIYLTYTTYQE